MSALLVVEDDEKLEFNSFLFELRQGKSKIRLHCSKSTISSSSSLLLSMVEADKEKDVYVVKLRGRQTLEMWAYYLQTGILNKRLLTEQNYSQAFFDADYLGADALKNYMLEQFTDQKFVAKIAKEDTFNGETIHGRLLADLINYVREKSKYNPLKRNPWRKVIKQWVTSSTDGALPSGVADAVLSQCSLSNRQWVACVKSWSEDSGEQVPNEFVQALLDTAGIGRLMQNESWLKCLTTWAKRTQRGTIPKHFVHAMLDGEMVQMATQLQVGDSVTFIKNNSGYHNYGVASWLQLGMTGKVISVGTGHPPIQVDFGSSRTYYMMLEDLAVP